MKTYKIFVSPLGKTEAVKQGWSWPGFFFNMIWVLVKKMWVAGISLWGLWIGWCLLDIFALQGSRFAEFSNAVNIGGWSIGLPFAVGYIGNLWRELHLKSRGFEFNDTVQARNPEAALALWTKRRIESGSR